MTPTQFIVKYLWWTYRPLKIFLLTQQHKKDVARLDALQPADQRIFYLGITNHPNLGDMGQHYCIKKWIRENYPKAQLIMYEANPVVNNKSGFIKKLKSIYRPNDIILFQSGYCTQDLGGLHNLMHEMIAEELPNARILMLPQTIYFQKEENKVHTARVLDKASRMLFLARDMVSYRTATEEMFKRIKVVAYPDIVTTLIGTLSFNNSRDGVCLCTRNDGEKYYSDNELTDLNNKLISAGLKVNRKDTQSSASSSEIRNNLQQYIEKEIDSYSHYKVTITDRYHGTIFSLCAGTPVIIIKTNDHKVTTGADWFKGIYDDYVQVADSLEDAYAKCQDIIAKNLANKLDPYFKVQYYDKLKDIFESI